MDAGRASEQALIWATALTLFVVAARAAQRSCPEPFALARLQLSVEARNLQWLASGEMGPVQLAGFGLPGLEPSVPKIRREDLLEKTSVGLR